MFRKCGILEMFRKCGIFFSFYFRTSSAVLSLLPDVVCDEGSDMYNKLIGEPHPPYLVIGGYISSNFSTSGG
jgi:hypothetical protein